MNLEAVRNNLNTGKNIEISSITDKSIKEEFIKIDKNGNNNGLIDDPLEKNAALAALNKVDKFLKEQLHITGANIKLDLPEINKINDDFKINVCESKVNFQGTRFDCDSVLNRKVDINVPIEKLVLKINWKQGDAVWFSETKVPKGFKLLINNKTYIPQGDWRADDFFRAGKSGTYEIPMDKYLTSIQICNAAIRNMDFSVEIEAVPSTKKQLSNDEIKGKFPQVFANSKRSPHLNSFKYPTIYKKYDDGILVEYIDSSRIHTESTAYAQFLLSQEDSSDAQYKFAEIDKKAEKHFPKINNLSVLGWEKDADTSAADADVFRIVSYYQAGKKQEENKWKTTGVNYMDKAKKASADFLDNEVIKAGKYNVPLSGISISEDKKTKSPFFVETESEYIFQYNPSYSFSLASSLLKGIDDRWTQVKNTQNEINAKIIQELGVVDWCVVKINKATGDLEISADLDKFFPKRDKSHKIGPYIEWPRLIIDHLQNYLRNQDKDSLKILKLVHDKYTSDLNGLKFAGYENEVILSLRTGMKYVFNELTQKDKQIFEEQVLDAKCYYGREYEKQYRYSFNQLLIGMFEKEFLGKDNK